jgi:glutathione S-transferase
MPLIKTVSEHAKRLRGVHLFHAGMSNCSQRIRIVLEEKGMAWESHLVDLDKHEHLTEQYQQINPNGVVPTLVHDGQVIIESNDIIRNPISIYTAKVYWINAYGIHIQMHSLNC